MPWRLIWKETWQIWLRADPRLIEASLHVTIWMSLQWNNREPWAVTMVTGRFGSFVWMELWKAFSPDWPFRSGQRFGSWLRSETGIISRQTRNRVPAQLLQTVQVLRKHSCKKFNSSLIAGRKQKRTENSLVFCERTYLVIEVNEHNQSSVWVWSLLKMWKHL